MGDRVERLLEVHKILLQLSNTDECTYVEYAMNVAYFPFNFWLSFQRLCRL